MIVWLARGIVNWGCPVRGAASALLQAPVSPANGYRYNGDMSAKKTVNLEKALANLEDIVEELESGDLPLEKAMKKFEEGVKLTRTCQAALKEAEQKVEILLESAGGEELEDFDVEDAD
jgi:exodeoxyribonuclease VII small subunit